MLVILVLAVVCFDVSGKGSELCAILGSSETAADFGLVVAARIAASSKFTQGNREKDEAVDDADEDESKPERSIVELEAARLRFSIRPEAPSPHHSHV